MIKRLCIHSYPRDAEVGEEILLSHQTVTVVECIETGLPMVHFNANEITEFDFEFLRMCNLTVAMPGTKDNISVNGAFRADGDLSISLYIFFASNKDREARNLFEQPRLKD